MAFEETKHMYRCFNNFKVLATSSVVLRPGRIVNQTFRTVKIEISEIMTVYSDRKKSELSYILSFQRLNVKVSAASIQKQDIHDPVVITTCVPTTNWIPFQLLRKLVFPNLHQSIVNISSVACLPVHWLRGLRSLTWHPHQRQ